MNMNPLIRKECWEEIMSPRGIAFFAAGSLVLSAFGILMVSNTELSLLDNAQALYMMAGIVTAIASLIAIIRGSDGFAGERERGTLEPLLLTPISSKSIAMAKLIGVLSAWVVLYILAVPYFVVIGSSGQNLGAALVWLFLTGTLLSLFFGSLALALSARMRSFKGTLSIGLTLLLLCASPVIIGPSLRQSAIGRIMDLLNPFAGAMNMLDSVVIDSQGVIFQVLPLVILISYALAAFYCLYLASRRVEL